MYVKSSTLFCPVDFFSLLLSYTPFYIHNSANDTFSTHFIHQVDSFLFNMTKNGFLLPVTSWPCVHPEFTCINRYSNLMLMCL